jgi:hypothetical protein
MSLLVALARALAGLFLPDRNPLDTGEGYAARHAAALKLLEDDVYGYLLLTVHREDNVRGRVELAVRMEPGYWPAANATLERIIAEAP